MPSFQFASRSAPRARTVLVADHFGEVRKFVKLVLSQHGFQVLEAANGLEAFEQSEQQPGEIDLLIVDMNMPGMDGRQLPYLLAGQQPDMAVVFTNCCLSSRVVKNRDDIFVGKPFSALQLLDGVQAALNPSSELFPTRQHAGETIEWPGYWM